MDAPPGSIMKDCPVQMTPEFTVMVGVMLTVTELTAGFTAIQPKALVPVTEYEVFTNGLTTVVPDE